MRAYEAVFIFDPELSEDSVTQLKERIVNTINSSGNLLGIDIWGKRKLAYPINKKLEGIYYIFEFMGDATLPKELKRLTTITESIIRSMIVVNEKKTKFEVSKEATEVGSSIKMKDSEEEKEDTSEITTSKVELEDSNDFIGSDSIESEESVEIIEEDNLKGE
ncbi:MAG TPA: 30S ribosomal protein S6 [Caldisericia bacterium]|nr:30S ribosomal protein S6 [Caldisericia bacterium]HQG81776.1 30S ribosomal protein S6 [Caldisericia bacterium]HXK69694.1 30S ribosomal protein S6 [Caldisericia bacterium]